MSIYEYERTKDRRALAEALTGASQPEVRREAARALGDLVPDPRHDPAVAKEVYDALKAAGLEDEDRRVRALAVEAFDRYGLGALTDLVAAATDQPAGAIGPGTFVALSRHDRPELRLAAIAALEQLDQPSTIEPIVTGLRDPDDRVRERAAHACGRLGVTPAAPELIARLDDDSAAVRAAVASAIGELGLAEAVEPLSRIAHDDAEVVRLAALDALGSIGTPDAVDPIAHGLTDESPSVAHLAIYALIDLLTNAPSTVSHEVREAVVSVATAADRTTVVPALVDLIDTIERDANRRNAVWLLGRVVVNTPDQAGFETLIDCLDADDTATAQMATTSLASCPADRVEPLLLARLRDAAPGDDIRARIVFILGRIGTERAHRPLERLLEDTESTAVRRQAMAALDRIERLRGASR